MVLNMISSIMISHSLPFFYTPVNSPLFSKHRGKSTETHPHPISSGPSWSSRQSSWSAGCRGQFGPCQHLPPPMRPSDPSKGDVMAMFHGFFDGVVSWRFDGDFSWKWGFSGDLMMFHGVVSWRFNGQWIGVGKIFDRPAVTKDGPGETPHKWKNACLWIGFKVVWPWTYPKSIWNFLILHSLNYHNIYINVYIYIYINKV